MSSKRVHGWTLSCVLLASGAVAQPMRAQEREVTLAVVRALPDSSATAKIVREPGAKGRTIIVLPEANANAIALATAFSSLERSLKTDGEEPKHQIVITLHGLRSLPSLSDEEHGTADDYVTRLRKMNWQDLPGFGPARVLLVPFERLSLPAASGHNP